MWFFEAVLCVIETLIICDKLLMSLHGTDGKLCVIILQKKNAEDRLCN